MRDDVRRTELGKMFIDVAKYVLTIVVIGGMLAGPIKPGIVALGLILTGMAGAIGFLLIPAEERVRDDKR